MKISVTFLIFFLAIGSARVFAQDSAFVLRGKVVDSIGNEVPYASLHLIRAGKHTMADEHGKFNFGVINIPEDTLVVSSVAYEDEKIIIKPESILFNSGLKIRLKFYFKELSPVVVTTAYNLDTVLYRAFEKFWKNYAPSSESNIFLRATQRKDEVYTGMLEARGWRYDEGLDISLLSTSFSGDFYNFYNARSTGFRMQELVNLRNFNFTSLYMRFLLPWKAEWYHKSKVRVVSNERNIISITLKPNQEYLKELKKLDKRFGFSYNTPSIFYGMKRTYFIDLANYRILSMAAASLKVSSARYDHEKRKYLKRRYYYRFMYQNDNAFLDYAKEDITFTTPDIKKESPVHFVVEIYSSNQKKKTFNKEALFEHFKVRTDIRKYQKSELAYHYQDPVDEHIDLRFCHLIFKGKFDKAAWYKHPVPTFQYRESFISDMKQSPFINDFIPDNEK